MALLCAFLGYMDELRLRKDTEDKVCDEHKDIKALGHFNTGLAFTRRILLKQLIKVQKNRLI